MFGEFGEVFDLTGRDASEARGVDRLHDSTAVESTTEDLELAFAKDVAEVGDLHTEARVGLIAAVAVHGVLVGQALEWRWNLDPFSLTENSGKDFFHQGEDVVLCDKGSFDVELGELRLTVGAQVFVTEAAGDLEILFNASDHEELLVLLRGLREGVERTRREARGNEEVAGAFRRAFGKDRSFDFEEALGVHHVAHRFCDAVTKAQVASHLLTTEVEIAVGETEIFVGNLVVKLEGQNLSGIQDVERGGDDFDRARFEARVLGSGQAGRDFTSDADHVLTTEFV